MVATDAGREGELIWCYIREICGYTGPTQRLWLSESTPAAVKSAFASLRAPMCDMDAAARARAEADWVVGLNATMALSARPKLRAAGRWNPLGMRGWGEVRRTDVHLEEVRLEVRVQRQYRPHEGITQRELRDWHEITKD